MQAKIEIPEYLIKFEKVLDECKTETGISDELITKVRHYDFSDNSEKTQCFSKCILTKYEIYDKEGKLIADRLVKQLLHKEPLDASNEKQVAAIVDKCLTTIGKTPCETAYNFNKCYFTKRFGSKEHLETVKSCVDETKSSHSDALKVKFGDFSLRDKKLQCLTSCIFKKEKTFKDGKIDRDAMIKEVIKEEGEELKYEITKAIDKCLSIVGADECETAYKTFECYWNLRYGLEKTKEHVKICTKEQNITEDIADRLKLGQFVDRGRNTQCFGACLFKKQGFFDKDGKLARDVIIGRLVQKEPEVPKFDKIIESVDKCISLVGADECETAFKFYECYWTNRFGLTPPSPNPKIAEVLKSTIAA